MILLALLAAASLGGTPFRTASHSSVSATVHFSTAAFQAAAVDTTHAHKAHKKSSKVSKAHASNDTTPSKKVAPQPAFTVTPLPNSILPSKRIVVFYGNPLVKKMGVLGEYPEPV
ncbi:MAG: hypothetical protein ABI338_04390, partial [Gemmatimonadaceae bacterium]